MPWLCYNVWRLTLKPDQHFCSRIFHFICTHFCIPSARPGPLNTYDLPAWALSELSLRLTNKRLSISYSRPRSFRFVLESWNPARNSQRQWQPLYCRKSYSTKLGYIIFAKLMTDSRTSL